MSAKIIFRSKLTSAILACSALLIPLFVFQPLSVFASNNTEFTLGYLNLLGTWAIPLLLILIGSTALLSLLPSKIFRVLVALILGLALAIYVQGNFLVGSYGIFDGTEIPWDKFQAQRWIDATAWSLILLGALIFHKKVFARSSLLATALLVVQVLSTASQISSFSFKWTSDTNNSLTRTIYDFNPQKNVVAILLDGYSSPAFQLLTQRNSQIEATFKDFTYFKNTLASFATTSPSIPSILTGQEYDNTISLKAFWEKTLRATSLPSKLFKQGLQVDLATLPQLCPYFDVTSCQPISYYWMNDPVTFTRNEAYQLLDVVFFRNSPTDLKMRIYNNQTWFLQSLTRKRKGVWNHVSSIEFIESVVRYSTDKAKVPTFKFMHILIPHAPTRLDRECNFIERSKIPGNEAYLNQAECGLSLVTKVLKRMKDLGVYENSFIIVLADHGANVNLINGKKKPGWPRVERATPLLLIKPWKGQTLAKVSNVPAQLIDVPATIAQALGLDLDLPGESVLSLKEDSHRERKFHSYFWSQKDWFKEYLPEMQEYIVRGDSWNIDNWSEGKKYPPAVKE